MQRAVAAARLNLADDAYGYLREARELGDQVGDGRNDYNTEFGPTNVALHEVAVAVDLGDAGVALRAAQTVDASGCRRNGRHASRSTLPGRMPSDAKSLTPFQRCWRPVGCHRSWCERCRW